MLSLLVSLLILVLILGLFYWVISMIPIPAEFAWIVRVVFAIICAVALISLLTGAWSFPLGHTYLR